MRTMEPNLKTNFFFSRLFFLSYRPSLVSSLLVFFSVGFHSVCCLLLCPPFFRSSTSSKSNFSRYSFAIPPFCVVVLIVWARARSRVHTPQIYSQKLSWWYCFCWCCCCRCWLLHSVRCSRWTTIFVSHSFVFSTSVLSFPQCVFV